MSRVPIFALKVPSDTKTLISGMENSSPTNSGPDSEVASNVSELPQDARKSLEPGYIPEDLTNKVAAATSYVGSFFNPSAWKNPSAEKSPDDPEGETSEKKSPSNSSGISNSIFSAIGKVQEFTKVSPSEETSKDENTEAPDCEKEKSEDQAAASGGFFSAFSKIGGISGMKSSNTTENVSASAGEGSPKDDSEDADDKRKETWGNSLSNAFNKVGKAATDYSKGNLSVMRT